MIGLGDRGIDRSLAAPFLIEGDIAGTFLPHRQRVREDGPLGPDEGGQRLVFDVDELGRVFRRIDGLGDDERDSLADEAHGAARQMRLRRDEARRAVLALARHARDLQAERGHRRHPRR